MTSRLLLACCFAAAAAPLSAATFTVDSLFDTPDQTINGVCADSANRCTLRAAIQEANATTGIDNVQFSVSGRLLVGSALPAIVRQIQINGHTAPGAPTISGDTPAPPVITIDGAGLGGSSADGLLLAAGSAGSFIHGLAIVNFPDNGIEITSGNTAGSIFSGLWLGVEPNETPGPNDVGLLSATGSHTIGEFFFFALSGRGNVISGNANFGVRITGDSNTLTLNRIGTNAAGNSAIANGGIGLSITGDNNTIGRAQGTVSRRNIISGNNGNNVRLIGDDNNVIGNHIGVQTSSFFGLPNGGDCLSITGDDNVIGSDEINGGNRFGFCEVGVHLEGGLNPSDRNDIEANVFTAVDNGIEIDAGQLNIVTANRITSANRYGIFLRLAANITTVTDNRIGVFTPLRSAQQRGVIGGGLDGIAIEGDSSLIGRNEIGNFEQDGIALFGSSGGLLFDNVIGTITTNTSSNQGVGRDGIRLANGANAISVNDNLIAFSGGNAVTVIGNASVANRLSRNAMTANAGIGIDLGNDGYDNNDGGDGDTGPNQRQNTPVVTAAVFIPGSSPMVEVTYFVNTSDPAAYPMDIEFFLGDMQRFDQGGEYLSELSYDPVAPSGSVTQLVSLPNGTLGGVLLATATTTSNNTSEFSYPVLFGDSDLIFADSFDRPVP